MGLSESLATLIADAPPANACIVAAWRAKLDESTRNNFDAALENGGLTTVKIWSTIQDDVPYGRTSLRAHRQGECTCKN